MTCARRACLLLLLVLLPAACGRDADAPGATATDPAATPAARPGEITRNAGVEPAVAASLPVVTEEGLDTALAGAEAALEAGRLERDGDGAYGALDWYEAARAIAPDDARIRTGIERGLDALLERGLIAMRRGELAEARRIGARAQALQRDHRDLANYEHHLARTSSAQAAVEAADIAARAGRFDATADDAAPAALRRALGLAPGYRPALAARERWVRERVARAWTAAEADDHAAAAQRLHEAAALDADAPALLAMRLRIGERRAERTAALLQEGLVAVRRLDLDAAEDKLRAAEAIAAQAQGVERLRERIFLARHYGHFEPGQAFAEPLADGGRAPELTVVRFGRYTMGHDDDRRPAEGPEHEVAFARGFAIGRNEVTVADFRRFVEATGYRTRATREGQATVFDERGGSLAEHEGVDWRRDFLGRTAADDRPVIHVAFEDAQAYVDWLTAQTGARYRLPSEAEWEYVLRAGRRAPYPWGEGAPPKGVGNLSGEGDKSTHGRSWGTPIRGYTDYFWGTAPVRSFAPEPWGTHDMVGNVSEWVLDCWHDSYRRAPADGSAWINPGCRQRVVRGASWSSSLGQARSAARMPLDAKTTQPWLGFRVVREI